ncbi:hypothetical protein TrVE_jg13072 [Triparma verrucosa]|uniref:Uncharacterized protein n=1 Tax=Triparma verrucosa TaxID=1606542 RepID=A0A9W7F4F8_9STRA|nr:hypothetical protein TrVE_jg13072 [Triparma verrucosa]
MSSCLLTPSSDLPPNPLLCVFYSIFDDAIGPVLSSAYPPDLPLHIGVPTFDDFKAALKTPERCPLSACYHSARKGDLTSPVPVPASGGLWKELVEYIITNHTSQPPNNVICVHVPPTSPGPGGITLISCPARLKSEIYDRNSFTFNISFFVLGKDASCYVDSCLRLSEALINAEKECSFLTNPTTTATSSQGVEKICQSVFQSFNSTEARLTTVIGNDVITLSRVDPSPNSSLIIPPIPNKSGIPILTSSSFVAKDLTVPFIVPSLNGVSSIREVAAKSEVDVGNILQCVRVIVREGKGVLRSRGGTEINREGKVEERSATGLKEIVHCYPCAVQKVGRKKIMSKGLQLRLDEVVVAAVDGTRSEEELEDILGLKRDEIKRSCERMGREYACIYI